MENRKLTPNQQAFADYYIEIGNATQAYLKAYKSVTKESTARANASRLLTNANVKSYINKKMKEIASKRIMSATEALELLTSIARGEITEEVVVSTFEGVDKVEKIPDIRDRQRAAEEILKRYTVSDADKLREDMLKAQIDKIRAETQRLKGDKKDTSMLDALVEGRKQYEQMMKERENNE